MERLAEKIREWHFDWYVAITRGGMVPTCLLAQLTGMWKIDTFCMRSYTDKDEKDTLEMASKNVSHLWGMDVLLIDDLVDTGDTMAAALQYMKVHGQVRDIKTAVVYKKADSLFTPDFFIEERPGDQWIVFPWEETQGMTSKVKE